MTDRAVVVMVVLCLGLFALGDLGAIVLLSNRSITVPQELNTLGGVAVGALASLLASTRTQTPVPVSGPAGSDDPVNVREVPDANS